MKGSFVIPQVFLIAQTEACNDGLTAALAAMGASDFASDAAGGAELLIEFAGKSCYNSFALELNANLTRIGGKSNETYIRSSILNNGHGSVLEHATVTFFLHNVSRIVTHEIVRHRAGTAFSQTSGRYVRSDKIDMYLPEDLKAIPGAETIMAEMIEAQESAVAKLSELSHIDMFTFATKKRLTSAFRRIIGNGQANNLVLTANHRAWRHMIELRTSEHAEEEVRLVFGLIAEVMANRYPAIYSDMYFKKVKDSKFKEALFHNHKV